MYRLISQLIIFFSLKVASSTWCRHFAELANPTEQQMHKWRLALQRFAPALWPFPEEKSLEEAMEGMISFMIVRHPLKRVASVYYEKIFTGLWAKINKAIIKNFRDESTIFEENSTFSNIPM